MYIQQITHDLNKQELLLAEQKTDCAKDSVEKIDPESNVFTPPNEIFLQVSKKEKEKKDYLS